MTRTCTRTLVPSPGTAAPAVQKHKHTLSVNLCGDGVWVSADATRMEEVIVNLLHNAAKFTPNGGKIELAAAREGEHAVIRVKDNGIGMTPQLLKSAFELFKQGQQGIDRPEGGLGVGERVRPHSHFERLVGVQRLHEVAAEL